MFGERVCVCGVGMVWVCVMGNVGGWVITECMWVRMWCVWFGRWCVFGWVTRVWVGRLCAGRCLWECMCGWVFLGVGVFRIKDD